VEASLLASAWLAAKEASKPTWGNGYAAGVLNPTSSATKLGEPMRRTLWPTQLYDRSIDEQTTWSLGVAEEHSGNRRRIGDWVDWRGHHRRGRVGGVIGAD
ncbi:MAG: hypothetical protein KC492_16200, partial [Myxococcales bacterium]|nr:hypothetical protein [Myxococcales bacterium]